MAEDLYGEVFGIGEKKRTVILLETTLTKENNDAFGSEVGWALPTSRTGTPGMPDYRRYFVLGGTYFFTVVTYQRRPLFSERRNVERLRNALRAV